MDIAIGKMAILNWIKQGLKMLREFQNKDVEGVLLVDADQMGKDLQVKENRIIKIIRTISNETEYGHIR